MMNVMSYCVLKWIIKIHLPAILKIQNPGELTKRLLLQLE